MGILTVGKAIVMAVLILFAVVILDAVLPRDDTDTPTERSGMGLYTDHRTGCQYLGRSLGTLTPRLDAEGKPMCGKP